MIPRSGVGGTQPMASWRRPECGSCPDGKGDSNESRLGPNLVLQQHLRPASGEPDGDEQLQKSIRLIHYHHQQTDALLVGFHVLEKRFDEANSFLRGGAAHPFPAAYLLLARSAQPTPASRRWPRMPRHVPGSSHSGRRDGICQIALQASRRLETLIDGVATAKK
jgi:hypothetical protein